MRYLGVSVFQARPIGGGPPTRANFLGVRNDVVGMESRTSDVAVLVESVAVPAKFSQVYERHLQAVAAYLGRRVGSELAEDLTAEVFVRAFRARAGYRQEHETALPWLLGIANHLVADHRRAERRRLVALKRLCEARTSVDRGEVAVLASDLVGVLRRMPAAERDTLLLLVWGELSYAETAAALQIPVGTVRSRIARARQRLSTAISAEASDAGLSPPPVTAEGDTHA